MKNILKLKPYHYYYKVQSKPTTGTVTNTAQ